MDEIGHLKEALARKHHTSFDPNMRLSQAISQADHAIPRLHDSLATSFAATAAAQQQQTGAGNHTTGNIHFSRLRTSMHPHPEAEHYSIANASGDPNHPLWQSDL